VKAKSHARDEVAGNESLSSYHGNDCLLFDQRAIFLLARPIEPSARHFLDRIGVSW
jgi:hypothetical protein